MVILPFDAHNHVHLGPTQPLQALLASSAEDVVSGSNKTAYVSGCAIMSTHPRDFERVLSLSKTLPLEVEGPVRIVPCFGVHPWFLHEVSEEDLQEAPTNTNSATSTTVPKWIRNLEDLLTTNPTAIVGEIGLDGFHFDPDSKELVSSMDKQTEAFRMQMEIAARLKRPVSIHTVQCFGPLFDTINLLKKNAKKNNQSPALPPKMYFHAFGGKAATIDQILAMCGKKPGQVYFGFAPIVNFRSPKTADVIRKVGIDRLVLESDLEDASGVSSGIDECIQFLASTLEIEKQQVIERTTANAFDLYGLN